MEGVQVVIVIVNMSDRSMRWSGFKQHRKRFHMSSGVGVVTDRSIRAERIANAQKPTSMCLGSFCNVLAIDRWKVCDGQRSDRQ